MAAFHTQEEAAAALGIAIMQVIPPDGRLTRFGDKQDKGIPHFAVNYGDRAGCVGTFQHGFRKATWCIAHDGMDEQQHRRLKYDIALAKANHKAEQRKRWNEGAMDAAALWNSLSTSGTSAYLTRKKVGAYGIRFGNGFIAIPLRHEVNGAIHSLQLIYDDVALPAYMKEQGRNKTFIKDGRKQGCFHVIGGKLLDTASDAYICEGYATGCSIYMASGKPVFVAFDCGNLLPVVKRVKALYPSLSLTIAADNDCWKPEIGNAGVEKAQEAANACNVRVIIPEFFDSIKKSKPTDFNDLHILVGLDAVQRMLEGDI